MPSKSPPATLFRPLLAPILLLFTQTTLAAAQTPNLGPNPNTNCPQLPLNHSAYLCEFLQEHPDCITGGLIDYLKFFYCSCRDFPVVGHVLLLLWLIILFYMLGNTAADYFCCSLAKLAGLLRLSPSVAGVTLLPLGNGAPDVFSSIAAFVGSDSGGVGINSVLGGAVFVTCVVVGVVSLFVDGRNVRIDRKCFVRDVGFFLFSIVALVLVLFVGRIGVFGAGMFVMVYVCYAFVVAANEVFGERRRRVKWEGLVKLLPVKGSLFTYESDGEESIYSPFLDGEAYGEVPRLGSLPDWMWSSQFAIYSSQMSRGSSFDGGSGVWGNEGKEGERNLSLILAVVQIPLSLPRRLTIPVVEEERWSKFYAVSSALFSPILLAFLWNMRALDGSESHVGVYVVAIVLGVVLASLAWFCTSHEHPPRRYLLPWVTGGFVMSIVWFYIVANELLALLVSLGVILHINPSLLGVTVLAWGNSMGDLMSNIALAMNGGDGVQIAMSGCYAGPMFNTLIGLGMSMLLGACKARPALYLLPRDSSLICTVAFLVAGLVWALIVLPRNEMCPNKVLGFGLITIYLIFISVRVGNVLGVFSGFHSH